MEFLQEKGVSNQTILNGISRNKTNKTSNWVEKSINQQLFIAYTSLPKQSAKKLPSESLLWDLAKVRSHETKEEQRRQLVKFLSDAIQRRCNSHFVEHLPDFTGKVKQDEAIKLAKKAEMMLCLIRLKGEYNKRLLHEAHLLVENAPARYESYVSFTVRMEEAEKALLGGGLHAKMLHGNLGKSNARKLHEDLPWGKALISWYGSPTKPSLMDVWLLYRQEQATTKLSWPEIKAVRSVGNFLNQPKIRKIWYASRHGMAAAREVLEPTIKRRKASFPDALWTCDGTTMQLVYVNEQNKTRKALYVYLVVDSYSGAIIGHSIGLSEDSALVAAALKDAITKTGHLPHTLQYDNSSANVSSEVQAMMSKMAKVHFPCEPYNGRAKRVERVILELEQRYLRHHEFFKGGNITVKSLDSKANPEYLVQLQKNRQLPDLDRVIQAFEESIYVYNHDSRKAAARIGKYGQAHEKRRPTSPLEYATLFMNRRRETVRYKNFGLTVQVGKERHTYEVVDKEGKTDYDFFGQYLDQSFEVHLDHEDLSMVALYRENVFVTYAFLKKEFAESQADMRAGERSELNERLKKRKAHLDENNKAYSAISTDCKEEAVVEMGHKALFKDLLNQMHGNIQEQSLGLVQEDEDELQPVGAPLNRSNPFAPKPSLKPIDLDSWEDEY
ncbi:transposase family protein [Rufibacter immobilis]|uniref:transposase family protein n=1 Tax=Rufibacter immobilis TaxID=1348778 RepID=UPI0035EAADB1